jgi:hypothetical protein
MWHQLAMSDETPAPPAAFFISGLKAPFWKTSLFEVSRQKVAVILSQGFYEARAFFYVLNIGKFVL